MTHLVTIRVEGPPIGKGRPRFARQGAKVLVYTPAQTRAYESALALIAKRQMRGRPPFEGPLRVVIYAHFPFPKALSQAQRSIACMTRKPDYDNIAKICTDSLNTIVFHDDAQIVEATIVKLYSSSPRLEIFVSEWDAP